MQKEVVKSAILEELYHLQKQGLEHIFLEESSLLFLEEKPVSTQLAPAPIAKTPSTLTIPTVQLPPGDKNTQWAYLKQQVLQCPECTKHISAGKQIVFGMGNLDADIFFCGEAPGAEEEIQGEPFVGPAGQLLTKIIQAMGLQRSDVYIANIMNWRPETTTGIGNRPPTQDEMSFCLPYLQAQLNIVQPKVIIALGLTAIQGLLGYDAKRRMSDTRGQWFQFKNTPLIATYHPSYLLHNSTQKAKRQVWEDILTAMHKLNMPISEKQKSYFL